MRSLLLYAILSLPACSGDPDTRPASWSYVHAALIQPSCATVSCHSERTAAAGIALGDPATAYDVLLGAQFVVPGDSASALMLLLEGNERPRMPPDAPLPQADIDLIRAWIEAGAER